jgi:hypothetical protein
MEINETYPDLEFYGNLAGGSWFYHAEKDMYLIFGAYAKEYPDKSEIDAIIGSVDAKAGTIFPNMGDKISKEDVEESGGFGWNIFENDGFEMYPEKKYVVCFRYAGYEFWYYTDDLKGELLSGNSVTVHNKNN